MVTQSTSDDLGAVEIHITIPAIDVTSHLAILGLVIRCMTTLEPPATIFTTIVMVTAHTSHYIICGTHEEERNIKIVLVTGPMTGREWVSHNILTHKMEATIFTTIVMVTLDSINCLLVVAVNIEITIEVVLVSIHSIEC